MKEIGEKGLQERLNEIRRKFLASVPPEAADVVMESIRDLVRSGIAEQAIKKGDRAPDFTLPEARGGSVTLSHLLTRGPVVLAFYRGTW